jgi:cation diffusion facilitator family transporter
MHQYTIDHTARSRAAWLSLIVGCSMLGLKMGAWVITGSATILSDALESVVHVAATGFMFAFFRWSNQPPDDDHPYGHGRASTMAVGFEGGMVLVAALAIGWAAFQGLVQNRPPEDLGAGLWLIGFAAAINLVLGLYLIRTGKRTRSAVLVADGQHVLSDVWTSVGVLAGVGTMLVVPDPHTKVLIDAGVAFALAAFVAWTAWKLIREAVAALMDEVDRPLLEQVVAAIDEIRDPQWIDVHLLRARASGDHIYVDFHLTVPAEWTIHRAHESIERLEQHILSRLQRPGAVLIHLDYPHLPGQTDPLATADLRPVPLTVDLAIRAKHPEERPN